jgi:hypothetical protein
LSRYCAGLALLVVLIATSSTRSQIAPSAPLPPSSPPYIDSFKCTEQPGSVYVFSGHISGAFPPDMEVHVWGFPTGDPRAAFAVDFWVSVGSDGSFGGSCIIPPLQESLVYAEGISVLTGEETNIASVEVIP